MTSFRMEFDRDYGISQQTGWSVHVDGICVCQFRRLPTTADSTVDRLQRNTRQTERADVTHSPEPWKNDPTDAEDIRDANGRVICSFDRYGYTALSEADAIRIVACVNACRGIPTEELLKSAESGFPTDQIARLFAAEAGLDVHDPHED